MGSIVYFGFATMFIWGEGLIFKTGTPDMMDWFYGMVFFAGWLYSLFPGLDSLWSLFPEEWSDFRWIGYVGGLGASIGLFMHVMKG